MSNFHIKEQWINCGNHVDDAEGLPFLEPANQGVDLRRIRLAAAAPELLRSCVELRDQLQVMVDRHGQRDVWTKQNAVIRVADHVIGKATPTLTERED